MHVASTVINQKATGAFAGTENRDDSTCLPGVYFEGLSEGPAFALLNAFTMAIDGDCFVRPSKRVRQVSRENSLTLLQSESN